jgi:hypothetical protein
MILINTMSLHMVPRGVSECMMSFHPLSRAAVVAHLTAEGFESAIAASEVAAVYSDALGIPVEAQRKSVRFTPGFRCIIGQYRGPRIEPGACKLSEGAMIEWFLVVCHKSE